MQDGRRHALERSQRTVSTDAKTPDNQHYLYQCNTYFTKVCLYVRKTVMITNKKLRPSHNCLTRQQPHSAIFRITNYCRVKQCKSDHLTKVLVQASCFRQAHYRTLHIQTAQSSYNSLWYVNHQSQEFFADDHTQWLPTASTMLSVCDAHCNIQRSL